MKPLYKYIAAVVLLFCFVVSNVMTVVAVVVKPDGHAVPALYNEAKDDAKPEKPGMPSGEDECIEQADINPLLHPLPVPLPRYRPYQYTGYIPPFPGISTPPPEVLAAL